MSISTCRGRVNVRHKVLRTKTKKKRRADEEDPLEDVHVAPLTDSWTQKRKRWGSVFTWERRPRPTSPRDVSRTRNEMLSRIVHAVSGWTERRRSCHESGSPFSRSANRSTDREPHGEESIIEERSDWEFLGVWERLRPGPHIRATRLHLPNRVIFSSAWRHRKTQARNRRRSSSSRMLSVTLSWSKRLFSHDPTFSVYDALVRRSDGSVRTKVGSIVTRERSDDGWSNLQRSINDLMDRWYNSDVCVNCF